VRKGFVFAVIGVWLPAKTRTPQGPHPFHAIGVAAVAAAAAGREAQGPRDGCSAIALSANLAPSVSGSFFCFLSVLLHCRRDRSGWSRTRRGFLDRGRTMNGRSTPDGVC